MLESVQESLPLARHLSYLSAVVKSITFLPHRRVELCLSFFLGHGLSGDHQKRMNTEGHDCERQLGVRTPKIRDFCWIFPTVSSASVYFCSLLLFFFGVLFWGVVGVFHARVSSGVVIKGAWFQCNLLAGLSKALDCWCGDMCLGIFWHDGRCEIPRGWGNNWCLFVSFFFFSSVCSNFG